jgi:hypothetical protein
MARWRAHFTRNPVHRVWIEVPEGERRALSLALVAHAMATGALIRDGHPEPGWVGSAHSRDGKLWPCKEHTQGARPAWIWTGDA